LPRGIFSDLFLRREATGRPGTTAHIASVAVLWVTWKARNVMVFNADHQDAATITRQLYKLTSTSGFVEHQTRSTSNHSIAGAKRFVAEN
jgi:hypothetical protein